MKKILASVLVLGLFITLGVTPVLARLPGPMMGPTAISVDFIYANVETHNFGSVVNFPWADANSGWNRTSSEGAEVETGKAKAGTDTTTGLNKAEVKGTITDSHFGPVAVNMDAGRNPLAVAADFIYVDVDNVNGGAVCNFSTAIANSGWNTTGKMGEVTTGEAEAKTKTETTLNTANTNVTVNKSVNGPIALNLEIEEGGMGAGSQGVSPFLGGLFFGKTAVAVDFNMVEVDNVNFGHVGNTSFAFANSGDNSTGEKSEVETGKALASTETNTNLNKIDNTVSVSEASLVGPVAVNFEYKEECEFRPGSPMGGSLALALDANVVLIDNNNFGKVSNISMADANTGMNKTGNKAEVTTGKATASTLTGSTVNTISNDVSVSSTSNGPIAINAEVEAGKDSTGTTACGVGCGGTVGPIAANIGTSGTAVAIDAAVVSVENTNVAAVTNVSMANANTGDNTTGCGNVPGPCVQSVNTLCGTDPCDPTPTPAVETTVTTGDATAETTTTNTVNTSSTTFEINR